MNVFMHAKFIPTLFMFILGTLNDLRKHFFVIGYYADHLSVNQETRGNSTVKVKNESRGFHLNNLSYAGPIVMGVGGSILFLSFI